MVTTHAWIAYASKWDVLVGYVHDDVVDTSASRWGAMDDFPTVALAPEIVKRQGFLALGDEMDNLLEEVAFEGYDWEYGSKYLFGHDGRCERWIV